MRARVVLWGGHPDRDVWIGSPRDRSRQARLQLVASLTRSMRQAVLLYTDAMTPALRAAVREMKMLAAAFGKDRP